VEESEASVGRLDRGKHVEHIEVLKHVNVSRSDSLGDHPWMANLSVRGTGCANARTSGSVGALAGNRQGHPARRRKPDAEQMQRLPCRWATSVRCVRDSGRFVLGAQRRRPRVVSSSHHCDDTHGIRRSSPRTLGGGDRSLEMEMLARVGRFHRRRLSCIAHAIDRYRSVANTDYSRSNMESARLRPAGVWC